MPPTPPGPKGYPLVGVLPHMRRAPLGFLAAAARADGGVVPLPLGPLRASLPTRPDPIG